jgi:AraC-like DNA-binding protein
VSTTDLSRVRVRVATTDPGTAFEALRDAFGVKRARVTGDPATFFHGNATEGTDRFSITRLRHTDYIEVDAAPLGYLMVGTLLSGYYTVESHSARLDTAGGRPFLFPHDEAFESSCRHLDTHLVNLDLDLVGAIAGLPAGTPLQFFGSRPMTDAAGVRWNAAVAQMLVDVIKPHGALDDILLRDASSREMAQLLLRTFASNALDPALDAGPAAAYGPVRRAVDFIESNATLPITLAQIAAASRVSPRGLQAAFQRHLGRSPMEHLRRIRLDAAHQELRDADPFHGVTVSGVARRWGFGHMGRFAAVYRARYGVTPRQTLEN